MHSRPIHTLNQPLTHAECPLVNWDVATMVCCQEQEACARAYAVHSTRLQEAAVERIREVLQSCKAEWRGVKSYLQPGVMDDTLKVTSKCWRQQAHGLYVCARPSIAPLANTNPKLWDQYVHEWDQPTFNCWTVIADGRGPPVCCMLQACWMVWAWRQPAVASLLRGWTRSKQAPQGQMTPSAELRTGAIHG